MSKIDIDTKIEKALAEIEKLKIDVLELKKEKEILNEIEESNLVFEKLLGDMVFEKELSVIEMSIFKYIIKEIFFYTKNYFYKNNKENLVTLTIELNIKKFFLDERFKQEKIKNILKNISDFSNVVIDYENTFIEQDILGEIYYDEENKKKKYNIDVRVEYSFLKFLKKIIIGEEIDITYNSYLFNDNKYKNAITNLEEIDKIYEIAFADKRNFNDFTNKEKALFEYIAKEIIKSPYKNLRINIINFLKFEENTKEEYKTEVKAIQNWVFNAFKIEMNLFTGSHIFFTPVTSVFSKFSELYSKKEFFIRLNFSDKFLEYFSKKDYFVKSNSFSDYYLFYYDDKLENKISKILNITMENYSLKNGVENIFFELILNKIIETKKENLIINISEFSKIRKKVLKEYEKTMFNLKEKLRGNLNFYEYQKFNDIKNKYEDKILTKKEKSFITEIKYPSAENTNNLTNILLEVIVNKDFLNYLENIDNNKRKIPYFEY